MKPCRWFTPFATIHICDLSTAPSFPVSGILNMLDLVDFHGKSTIPKTCRNVSRGSPKMSYLELGNYDSTRTDGVHSRHCYLNLPILCGAMPAPDLPQKRKLDGSASSSADPFEHQVHGDLPSKGKVLALFPVSIKFKCPFITKICIYGLLLGSNRQALARRARTSALPAKTLKIHFVPLPLPKAGTDKLP